MSRSLKEQASKKEKVTSSRENRGLKEPAAFLGSEYKTHRKNLQGTEILPKQ